VAKQIILEYSFFPFLNGTLIGIVFPYLVSFVLPSCPTTSSKYHLWMVLWLLTLAPFHKPITGLSHWNSLLGKWPAIISLVEYIIYGTTWYNILDTRVIIDFINCR
jgi:hypothetical protein